MSVLVLALPGLAVVLLTLAILVGAGRRPGGRELPDNPEVDALIRGSGSRSSDLALRTESLKYLHSRAAAGTLMLIAIHDVAKLLQGVVLEARRTTRVGARYSTAELETLAVEARELLRGAIDRQLRCEHGESVHTVTLGVAIAAATRRVSSNQLQCTLDRHTAARPVPFLVVSVVENLLQNALDHGEPQAKIRLAASVLPDALVIEVANRAPSHSACTRSPGLGVGVQLVRELLELTGGRLDVQGGGGLYRARITLHWSGGADDCPEDGVDLTGPTSDGYVGPP